MDVSKWLYGALKMDVSKMDIWRIQYEYKLGVLDVVDKTRETSTSAHVIQRSRVLLTS